MSIDHYNKGDGLQNPWLDEDIQPLALTRREIDDLVAFMASLTSPDYKEQGAKELARQRPVPDEAAPARHEAGVRSQAAPAQAARPLIAKQRSATDSGNTWFRRRARSRSASISASPHPAMARTHRTCRCRPTGARSGSSDVRSPIPRRPCHRQSPDHWPPNRPTQRTTGSCPWWRRARAYVPSDPSRRHRPRHWPPNWTPRPASRRLGSMPEVPVAGSSALQIPPVAMTPEGCMVQSWKALLEMAT